MFTKIVIIALILVIISSLMRSITIEVNKTKECEIYLNKADKYLQLVESKVGTYYDIQANTALSNVYLERYRICKKEK